MTGIHLRAPVAQFLKNPLAPDFALKGRPSIAQANGLDLIKQDSVALKG
jgi:hypothetical protein